MGAIDSRRSMGLLGLVAALVSLAGCATAAPATTGAPTETGAPATVSPAPVPSITPGIKCHTTPTPGAQVVRFPSPNGASIGGVVFDGGRTGVVLAHQSPGDLCDWWFYALRLAQLGYRVLAFDFNGTASSSPSYGNPGHAEFDVDVLAAAGVLRQRGATAVFAMGASLGGVAVVTAAGAAQPPLAGVIDLSSTTGSSGMDALGAARRLSVPALFVTSEHDTVAGETRQLAEAVTGASPEHRLVVVNGSGGHGVALLKPAEEPQAPQVRATVEQFLAAHAAK